MALEAVDQAILPPAVKRIWQEIITQTPKGFVGIFWLGNREWISSGRPVVLLLGGPPNYLIEQGGVN
ncbi:MAG: hypothetical protein A2729_00360 [Candidatus Buchananbacteria bacterium RIFCSPHIGHO2_01_FULL_39_14]|uniref:Uncharacterized protein n=2 Tax=Candidatus Buchananiibacteriota TaxID=1817903 RepID=A0A1G1YME4_9BACT|nr:MAG: hypothetical protein A2729_00360 [Candidatus Buchananbacteria bacterium RIFCSPHIGHO2_01_FULL_39_14]OGY48746.1 MAG: hypothetical protein A3D39_04745 [Candidatus Buchananbacteria bacterium RIFCSPHIGHO2_02_FULL_39_17]OGY53518.1 MAG: hypothetical protein A2912_06055 [Candidatus Buchananbacteria bacterium RIFCSPLOWO2_01_FULL_40_23b]